jgi:hypothetical protein
VRLRTKAKRSTPSGRLGVGIAAGVHWTLRHPGPRRRWHALLLGLWWIGPLVRGVDTARFAATLASAAPVMGTIVMRLVASGEASGGSQCSSR